MISSEYELPPQNLGNLDADRRVTFVRAKNAEETVETDNSDDILKAPSNPSTSNSDLRSIIGTSTARNSEKSAEDTKTRVKIEEDDEIIIVDEVEIKKEPEHSRSKCEIRDLNAFLKAAKDGSLEEIERLLREKKVPIDLPDFYGWTATMCAAAEGNFEVCRLLLEKGAEPGVRDSRGRGILDIAREKGQNRFVKQLMDFYCSSHIPSTSREPDRMSFCDACNTFFGESELTEHISTITHQLNDGKWKGAAPQTGIQLGPSNIGYRLMCASGWTEEQGLGRNSDGHRFPIRTILKRNRTGLGLENLPKKVTHFGPRDPKAVQNERIQKAPEMNEYGCNVCNDEYSTTVPGKAPRVLTGCGHTICHSCATSIAGTSFILYCPFDRTTTSIPRGDVQNLKKNFALLELLEKIADGTVVERTADSPRSDRYARERILNVECDEHAEHVAVIYCTVCDSNLCERCSETSHSTNVLSRHRRIPLSEKPPPQVHCKLHSSYVVEFFCKEVSCDNESALMCLMCRDYGRHKGHAHVLIEKEVEELREKVREHLGELTKKAETVDNSLLLINGSIHDLTPGEQDGTLEDTRQGVRNHFRRLRSALDRDESTAIDTLDSYAQNRVETLSNLKERLEAHSIKIGATCVALQRALIMEKGKILDRKDDLLALAESTVAEPMGVPDSSQLTTRIAFSFAPDRKLHIGDFIEARVVLLGLDGAGKTSIVRRLKKVAIDAVMAPYPTIGFNIETIHYKNYRFNFWDVGGLPKLRHLWKHYYTNTQAIFYVIDGHAVERFTEAIRELNKVMSDPLVGTCPVFVAINRKDGSTLNGHMDALLSQLDALPFQHNFHFCDASTGSGIDQIIDQISDSLSRLNGSCPV
ncbi:unnamed protein product [Caenorhabditis sp. 36 PRJEB53466]|nr:unnamed protein product [Caenorhabditis sp. 36 PRJEB53466]